MSQFQRENRYAVFKLKHLTEEQKQRLYDLTMELGPYNSVGECVVVEADWPNYEDTWAAIKAVSEGCYVPTAQLPDGMTLLGRRIAELTGQLHQAHAMHIDSVRHVWESRNCGSCSELAEKHDVMRAEIAALAATIFKTTKALTEAAYTLENELLPALEDKEPLEELIAEFRATIATTPKQCLLDIQANTFEQAKTPKSAKAGCIGEFVFTLENAGTCPECYENGHDDECTVCGGEANDDGTYDIEATVPWTTCKDIWKAMNQFAAADIRADLANASKGGE